IDEVDGDLRVNTVIAQHGDVVLTTRNGSILDSNSATTTDRDGRTVDVPNVVGINLSFAAKGGTIGKADDDLDIDTGVDGGSHVYGVLYAQADGSVYITESNYELNVLAAKSFGRDVRLTVPDTSLVPTPAGDPAHTTQHGEDLVLVPTGTVTIEQNNQQDVLPSDQLPAHPDALRSGIVAAVAVSLWVGDNVYAPVMSEITAGRTMTIRGD